MSADQQSEQPLKGTADDPTWSASPITFDEGTIRELRGIPLLATVNPNEIRCMDQLEAVTVPAGTVFVRQGEPESYFWIVLTGEVKLIESDAEGQEVGIMTYADGASFGEVPLLSNLPTPFSVRSIVRTRLVRLNEDGFWSLMTSCPEVRRSILRNMAMRFQKLQSRTLHQEKMASLGTLAAGLMHELNNPGAAARRASTQLRENLIRMHTISEKFSDSQLDSAQKACLFSLQKHAFANEPAVSLGSLEQSDAEERLAEWMAALGVPDAWKLAPALVASGLSADKMECVRAGFAPQIVADAFTWLEAVVSSMQLVTLIEESIGRVTELVRAVKTYAYEGKAERQALDINDSIRATVIILAHKFREKGITLEKKLAVDLPLLKTNCRGLNQIWTNLLDNAIDAVGTTGRVQIATWAETREDTADGANDLCVRIADNGVGIPPEIQAHIFDPFFTTKDVGVGTGLGLGIIHRIVEQYGGSIYFASEPGKTEFVVRLPSEIRSVES